MASFRVHKYSLAAILVAVFASSVLVAAKKPKPTAVLDPEPADEPAFKRGLLTQKVSYKQILEEQGRHWQNVAQRHIHGTVLGYVTPWNSRGYDVAKKFRAKFTHISPVWYQLMMAEGEGGGKGQKGGGKKKDKGGVEAVLQGRHNVDAPWVKAVRGDGSTKIVPRVNLEGSQVRTMVESAEQSKRVIRLIVDECVSQGFDGVVLEAWTAWIRAGVLGTPSLRQKVFSFLRSLGSELHAAKSPAGASLELVLVLPPSLHQEGQPEDPNLASAADLVALEDSVDSFSLMTYDFSGPQNPGFVAPNKWIRACLRHLLPHVDPVFPEDGAGLPLSYRGVDPYEAEEEEEDERLHGRELKSLGGGGGRGRGEGCGGLASKVLVGLNFYGMDYKAQGGGEPILGHNFLTLLETYAPTLTWSAEGDEFFFQYNLKGGSREQHYVFYPWLLSISTRLAEAEAWGAGIAIWELGQGLDIFYDLL